MIILPFYQMLKWAWIQYASLLIVFVYLFRRVKQFVYSKQILPTRPFAPVLKQGHTS